MYCRQISEVSGASMCGPDRLLTLHEARTVHSPYGCGPSVQPSRTVWGKAQGTRTGPSKSLGWSDFDVRGSGTRFSSPIQLPVRLDPGRWFV
jgi:hypothetical protein